MAPWLDKAAILRGINLAAMLASYLTRIEKEREKGCSFRARYKANEMLVRRMYTASDWIDDQILKTALASKVNTGRQ